MPITAARYAAVTATLALAVALGGTSYAATQVGTKQLKNGAVTTAKLADDAVTGAKVKSNSLTGADVKEGSLGQVPKAGRAQNAEYAENADSAARAATADRVGTTEVIDVSGSRLVNAGGRPLFPIRTPSLDVELSCTRFGAEIDLGLVADTTLDGGSIITVATNDADPSQTRESDLEDGAFAKTSEFDLLAGDDGDITQLTFTYRSGAGDVVQGTLFTDIAYHEPFVDADDVCSVQGFVMATSGVS